MDKLRVLSLFPYVSTDGKKYFNIKGKEVKFSLDKKGNLITKEVEGI